MKKKWILLFLAAVVITATPAAASSYYTISAEAYQNTTYQNPAAYWGWMKDRTTILLQGRMGSNSFQRWQRLYYRVDDETAYTSIANLYYLYEGYLPDGRLSRTFVCTNWCRIIHKWNNQPWSPPLTNYLFAPPGEMFFTAGEVGAGDGSSRYINGLVRITREARGNVIIVNNTDTSRMWASVGWSAWNWRLYSPTNNWAFNCPWQLVEMGQSVEIRPSVAWPTARSGGRVPQLVVRAYGGDRYSFDNSSAFTKPMSTPSLVSPNLGEKE